MPGKKHILVMRFSAMGDVALTVPVIKELLKQNPEVFITYVSRQAFAGFFDGIERLTYFAADLEGEHKGLAGIIKLYKTLKNNARHDGLADLHDSLRTKIIRKLFRFSGVNYSFIDKGRAGKKLLTQFPGKVLKPLETTAERYADVFRRLGVPVRLSYQLQPAPAVLSTDLLAITDEKDCSWIGIAPFAKHKGKIYPLEKMEQVIRSFEDKGVKIFLFGGSVLEEEICLDWQNRFKNTTSLVRKISMAQELRIISRLDVMLSMDSAGMHLASLQGVPVVSVWGATHHYAGFLGYGQSTENIVGDDIECRPCSIYGNKPCFRKDYACLYNIPPEAITNQINNFLSNKN